MPGPIIDPEWRDLTSGRRNVLLALAIHGPASGAELHQQLNPDSPQTAPTTHKNLGKLCDEGYVERGERDSRENVNRLTDAGLQVVGRGVVDAARRIESCEENDK